MATRRSPYALDTPTPYGWSPLIVLILVVLVDQIEANITSGVLPLLQAEFGVSDATAGTLATVESAAALLVALPAGYLADRYSRTGLVAVVVTVWSVVTLGSALAVSFVMFYVTRVVLATAENVENPAVSSLLGDYYPPRARGQAYGYHRMAYFAGGSLGVLVGGLAGQAFGWRGAYLLAMAPGLLVAWLCWRLAEPVRGLLDRQPTGEDGDGGDEDTDALASLRGGLRPFLGQLRALLHGRALVRVYLGLAALFLGVAGFGFWQTSYYVRVFELTVGTAAALTPIVDLIGIVAGTVVGARLGDRWNGELVGARILVGGPGLLVGSAVLGAGLLVHVLVVQLAIFTVATFLMSTAIPNLNAAIADLLPFARRGGGFALLQILVTIGAAAGPPLVGLVSDATGSLGLGFAVMAAVMVAGSVIVLTARSSYDADVQQARAESA